MDCNLAILQSFLSAICSGGSRIFSRGADFREMFENFVFLFFRLTKLILRALSKHTKRPVLVKLSAPPLEGTFRKFLGSFTKNACLKIDQRGGQGGRGSNPKSAPGYKYKTSFF